MQLYTVTANGVRRARREPLPRSGICTWCKAEYSTTASRQKYCSKDCQGKATYAMWREKHPTTAPAHHLPKGRPRGSRNIKAHGAFGLELHPFEVETLRWFSLGKDGEIIAKIMGNTPSSVNRRMVRITEKLGAVNRTHAVALWLRQEHAKELAIRNGTQV